MVNFFCTQCGVRLQVTGELAGVRVRCPRCATAVRTPDASDALPVADLAPLEALTSPTGGASDASGDELHPETAESGLLEFEAAFAARPRDASPEAGAAEIGLGGEERGSDPTAAIAQAVVAHEARPRLLPLDYASPPGSPRRMSGAAVEAFAERLARVQPTDPSDPTNMIECPYCGSTIAPFVARCPFCRKSMHGT